MRTNLGSNPDEYIADVNVQFSNNQNLPYTIKVKLNGEEVNNNRTIYIAKEDFDDSELSNLEIEVIPDEDLERNYNISRTSHYINIKTDIDKLKADEEIISKDPILEIIKVNGITSENKERNIKVGETITYSILREEISSISIRRLGGKCTYETVSNTINYTCTYSKVDSFEPSVKVADLNGITYYLKAPKVKIEDDENEKPSITIEKDETVYTKGEKIILKAIASDTDGRIESVKWQVFFNDIEIFNNTSLDNAYIYAPTLTEDKIKNYLFKLIVTDNDNASTTSFYTVKVQGSTTSKRELEYISDLNYEDTCDTYDEGGCSFDINSNLTTLTKQWKY